MSDNAFALYDAPIWNMALIASRRILFGSPSSAASSRLISAIPTLESTAHSSRRGLKFGNPVVPREWFLVPIFVIDEAVERIKNGTITGYRYNRQTASLKQMAI